MSFSINEFKDKKVHIIGIGGSMMSGIAGILVNNGITVTGSDFQETKALDKVRSIGATVYGGHDARNITDQDLVIYTAAIKEDNPELVRAKELNIPVMSRSEFLGHLLKNFKDSVGIAGTHGKTTTTSLLTSIAMSAGLDPTVLIGANVPLLGDWNYRVGRSEVMVVESCEYARSFLNFPPRIAVLLNIEQDHVDIYKDLDELKEAFSRYVSMVPEDGFVIANVHDSVIKEVIEGIPQKVITFGIGEGDIHAENVEYDENGNGIFDVYEDDKFLFKAALSVPGEHNIKNALAAIAAALLLGASHEGICEGLSDFSGVDRRLQELGSINGIRFIDDYGHHPTEVRVTMDTVLRYKYRKLIVVEQPHTFSRLNYFFDDFVPLFDKADLLILLPVYSAREKDTGLTSSKKLGDVIERRHTVETISVDSYKEAADIIEDRAKEGDIVLLIGAGEGYRVFDILKDRK